MISIKERAYVTECTHDSISCRIKSSAYSYNNIDKIESLYKEFYADRSSGFRYWRGSMKTITCYFDMVGRYISIFWKMIVYLEDRLKLKLHPTSFQNILKKEKKYPINAHINIDKSLSIPESLSSAKKQDLKTHLRNKL